MPKQPAGTKSLQTRNTIERTQLFLMGLPLILFVLVFSYLPLCGWILAFFDYKPGLLLFKTPFVGLKFFHIIMGDKSIWESLRNTLVFYLLNLATYPLPVLFAILLNEVKVSPVRKMVQTFTTLPNFVSWVIVFSLAFAMFSNDGMVNKLLLGWKLIDAPDNLLGNDGAVYLFQTLLSVWKNLGWSAIIYLAAMSGIDSELYDAARVDGAGRFHSMLHVTLPGIAPTFFVMLILGISSMLSVGFDQYLLFYNGIVADKITVLDLFVYRMGILSNDFSYSTAICMLKTFISILLLLAANGLSKKVRGQGII